MRYGSVCSGIEAASVAWEPLGWEPAWFAEVEAFPSAVLAHHWPEVENLGDMTTISRRVLLGQVEAPDVLTGGTPCQAFSVAGMREGLADVRGQLTISYVELADAIDLVRVRAGKPECVVAWENVPGVLSDRENAFGCFLGALCGEDGPLQPSGKKWTNAGCVYGPTRAVAWRVLDAQYFGLAQRRRRVWVVASARAGFDPAAVLLECEGVRRDSAPRREAGQGAAADAGGRIDCTGDGISGTVSSKWAKGTGGPAGDEHYNLTVVQAVTGDIAHALNTANNGKGRSEDGTGRGVPTICFVQNSLSEVRPMDGDGQITGALAAAPGVQQQHYVAQPSPCHTVCMGSDPIWNRELAMPQTTRNGDPGVVQAGLRVRRLMPVECERLQGFPDGHTDVPDWYACPCGHTFPEELGKYGCPNCLGENTARLKRVADGPRYKAIGNSWAVPCARWIGRRIQMNTQEAA